MADDTISGPPRGPNTFKGAPARPAPGLKRSRALARRRWRQRAVAMTLTKSKVPAHALPGQRRPLFKRRATQSTLKRLTDICGAVAGLFLLGPLLLVAGLLIRLTSRGPVLFRQTRLGQNGQPFSILKFRTMYVEHCDTSGLMHTVDNDPRVTKIGRFLRRSSFDELPQLINVLKGEMSLVGPRPYVPGMRAAGIPYQDLDHRYYDRLLVRPGITGLAQVNGLRGETSDQSEARLRLEHDLAYIEHKSFWLDLKIILGTIRREFFTGSGR